MKRKVIRLNENDIENLVKKIIKESDFDWVGRVPDEVDQDIWMEVSSGLDDATNHGPNHRSWVGSRDYRDLKYILSEYDLDIEDMGEFFTYPPKDNKGDYMGNEQLNNLYDHLVSIGVIDVDEDINESLDFDWVNKVGMSTVDKLTDMLSGSRYYVDVIDGEAVIKEIKEGDVWEFDPNITYSEFLSELLGNVKFNKENPAFTTGFDYQTDLYGYLVPDYVNESFDWVKKTTRPPEEGDRYYMDGSTTNGEIDVDDDLWLDGQYIIVEIESVDESDVSYVVYETNIEDENWNEQWVSYDDVMGLIRTGYWKLYE